MPASCIDSVDYMDVDTEAGAEVERWDEQRPFLDDSVGRPNNNTAIPTANGTSSCGHGGGSAANPRTEAPIRPAEASWRAVRTRWRRA